MEIRTDRIGLLLEQLTDGVELSRNRIGTISAAAFAWEPAPGAWSIRRRGEARTPDAFGPGDYVIDHQRSLDPFGPGPVSTIAWRVGHLLCGLAGRYEWTFGSRSIPPDDLVHFSLDPDDQCGQLWELVDRWATAVDGLTDEQLDTPGFGQYPKGLDPEIAFIGIVRWVNREVIHHLAEVALLLDLHDARRLVP